MCVPAYFFAMKLSILIVIDNTNIKTAFKTLESLPSAENLPETELWIGLLTMNGQEKGVNDEGKCLDNEGIALVRQWAENRKDLTAHILEKEKSKLLSLNGARGSLCYEMMQQSAGDYYSVLEPGCVITDPAKFNRAISYLDDEKNQDCAAVVHNGVREGNAQPILPFRRECKVQGAAFWRYGVESCPCSAVLRHYTDEKISSRFLPEFFFGDRVLLYAVRFHGNRIYYEPSLAMECPAEAPEENETASHLENVLAMEAESRYYYTIKDDIFMRYAADKEFFCKDTGKADQEVIQSYLPYIKERKMKEAEKWILFSKQNPFSKASLMLTLAAEKSNKATMKHRKKKFIEQMV